MNRKDPFELWGLGEPFTIPKSLLGFDDVDLLVWMDIHALGWQSGDYDARLRVLVKLKLSPLVLVLEVVQDHLCEVTVVIVHDSRLSVDLKVLGIELYPVSGRRAKT